VGAATIEVCEFACPAAYHSIGGDVIALRCNAGYSGRCELTEGSAYNTCDPGCASGYLWSGPSEGAGITQLNCSGAGIRCTELGASRIDSCDSSCPPGYHALGASTTRCNPIGGDPVYAQSCERD
jgi:hypothetical protein